MSTYHQGKVWSICQHVESHYDLYLWPIDLKINSDHLHPQTHVCAKFDKPRSILCLVIIWTRFGLYVSMLKVTVDLDLWPIGLKIDRDHLHSNTNVCAKFEESRSILWLVIIWTRFGLYQFVDGHCDLDLYPIDLKINRDHLHPKTHVCAKFNKPRSILCLVIIRTRFGLYVNMLKVTVTLTFNRLTSKSIGIIYTPRRMSVPNLRNLCQFCV